MLLDTIGTRVIDKRMVRLIRKWLKVGWLADGKRHTADKGIAQGATISPLLANIFLNAVMDQWFTNYHGIPGSTRRIRAFYTQIGRLWHWVICRRSHEAAKRWTWERFYCLQRHWLPRPRIVHPYPGVRFDAKYSR